MRGALSVRTSIIPHAESHLVSERGSDGSGKTAWRHSTRSSRDANSYAGVMKRHLEHYRTSVLALTTAGTWKRRDGTEVEVAHGLPHGTARLNIVPSVRDEFWRWFDAAATHPAPKLHTFFAHLTSSQAFAFNLFFPFLSGPPAVRAVLLRALGVPFDTVIDWEFEKIVDAAEYTNFDVWIKVDEKSQVLVEVKLTEDGFAKATGSPRRTPKLRKYREVLRPVLREDVLEDGTILANYQLFRNLSYLASPNTHVVLLTPRANKRTADGVAYARREVLAGSAPRLHTPWIEDVLDSLDAEVRSVECEGMRSVVSELRRKYLPERVDAEARHDPVR